MSSLRSQRLYRLVRPAYSPGLDGVGAKRFGGRWNSPGRAMIYTATNPSLAVLETFVHLPPEMRSARYLPRMTLVTLNLNAELAERMEHESGLSVRDCRAIGDKWLEETRSPALVVRSQLVPMEENVLLNPEHPQFEECVSLIREEPFSYDPRMGAP